MEGRVHIAPVAPGNLQVHWPESQVLLSGDPATRGKLSGIPDYNAVVQAVPLGAERGRAPEARPRVNGAAEHRLPGPLRPPPAPPPTDGAGAPTPRS